MPVIHCWTELGQISTLFLRNLGAQCWVLSADLHFRFHLHILDLFFKQFERLSYYAILNFPCCSFCSPPQPIWHRQLSIHITTKTWKWKFTVRLNNMRVLSNLANWRFIFLDDQWSGCNYYYLNKFIFIISNISFPVPRWRLFRSSFQRGLPRPPLNRRLA